MSAPALGAGLRVDNDAAEAASAAAELGIQLAPSGESLSGEQINHHAPPARRSAPGRPSYRMTGAVEGD
eukprot:gene8735-18223_t